MPAVDPTDAIDVPLVRLAWGRSGGKGDTSNVGVIARRPEYLPWIAHALTPTSVKSYLAHLVRGEVKRRARNHQVRRRAATAPGEDVFDEHRARHALLRARCVDEDARLGFKVLVLAEADRVLSRRAFEIQLKALRAVRARLHLHVDLAVDEIDLALGRRAATFEARHTTECSAPPYFRHVKIYLERIKKGIVQCDMHTITETDAGLAACSS